MGLDEGVLSLLGQYLIPNFSILRGVLGNMDDVMIVY
jgi:hypothetical protein